VIFFVASVSGLAVHALLRVDWASIATAMTFLGPAVVLAVLFARALEGRLPSHLWMSARTAIGFTVCLSGAFTLARLM
jgi:hypothetical protein